MNSETTRLQLLMSEYEQVKEDERSSSTIYATLIATGVAVLTALLVFTQQVIDHAGNPDQFPQPLIAIAPMSAVTVIAFAEWIGSRRSIRGFYLRVLEREIRAELTKLTQNERNVDFRSYQGLKIASLGELLIEHDSLSKDSETRGGLLIGILITCLTLIFGGITVALGYYTSSHWRWAMAVTYGGFFGQAVFSYIKANRAGREHFKDCVESYQQRLKTDLLPSLGSTKTWLYYILIPHPNDLIKSPFTIIGILIGAFTPKVTHNWGVIISVFLVIEILVYQCRYILNDYIGMREDQGAPSQRLRRRLPIERKSSALGWASLRMALAIWIILWIKEQVDGVGVASRLAIMVLVLALLGMVYEMVRNWERVRGTTIHRANDGCELPSWRRKIHAIIILALVTLGYPLRLIGGAWVIAGPSITMSGYQLFLIAISCISLGLVFVTPTWILEAFTYVNQLTNHGNTLLCGPEVRYKYHRMTLARISGFDLRLGNSHKTSSDFSNFSALRELKYRNFAPWRVGVAAYHISTIVLFYSLFPHQDRSGRILILLVLVLMIDILFNSTTIRHLEFYGKLIFCVVWGTLIYYDFLHRSTFIKFLIALCCFALLTIPVLIERTAERSGYADVLTMAVRTTSKSVGIVKYWSTAVWNGGQPEQYRMETK